MEAGNFKATKKPHKISFRRKHLNPRRVEAEPMPQKFFDDCGDTMLECIRNSKDVKSEDISGEYEQMGKFIATSSWVANQQAEEVSVCHKMGAGFGTLVEKPTPLPIDSNALVGEEDSYKPTVQLQAEQELAERRTSSENPVQGSRICEQETYAQLEANIKILQQENSKNCHDMQEISEFCAQLRRENRRLLKKLKKVCAPDTIAYLEAKNPDKKVDSLESSQ